MVLGKRSRPSMKRTTSMSELSATDLNAVETRAMKIGGEKHEPEERSGEGKPPRSIQRRSASDLPAEAHFLAACGLCGRRLGPGVNAFIYRGEVAFCSLECRYFTIKEEEQKKKFDTWMANMLKFKFIIPVPSPAPAPAPAPDSTMSA